MKLTDAYPTNFMGYNIKYLESEAIKKNYNLFEALIIRVDSQDNIPDRIKGMESILNDLI